MVLSFANEQAQQNDPVKKSVLARPICISDSWLYSWEAAQSTIFQVH